MTGFVVHTIIGSPFARAVLATLEEKHTPWRIHAITANEHRQPEHLAKHPFAKVPVLEHEGFWLYETQAILRYLDRVLPTPPLTPADPRRAARMDQMIGINDSYLFAAAAPIGFQRVVGPRLLGIVPDEAAIAAAVPKARPAIEALARLLGEHAFLTGAHLSLADLALAPSLCMLAETPEWAALTEGHPKFAAWVDRMQARPSMQATTWDRLATHAAGA